MSFVRAATALTLAAALLGLILIACRFTGRRAPRPLLYAHPVLGAAGVICLWIAVARWPGPRDLPFDAGALVFTFAFLGGALFFSLRLNRLPRPFFAVLLHGAAALFACALLLIGLVHVRGAG